MCVCVWRTFIYKTTSQYEQQQRQRQRQHGGHIAADMTRHKRMDWLLTTGHRRLILSVVAAKVDELRAHTAVHQSNDGQQPREAHGEYGHETQLARLADGRVKHDHAQEGQEWQRRQWRCDCDLQSLPVHSSLRRYGVRVSRGRGQW